MELDLGQKLKDRRGEDLRNQDVKMEKGKAVRDKDGNIEFEDYGPLRIGDAIAIALVASTEEKVDKEKKRRRFHLWQSIEGHMKKKKRIHLDLKDINLIDDAVDHRYPGSLVYGQIMEILDPPKKEENDESGRDEEEKEKKNPKR